MNGFRIISQGEIGKRHSTDGDLVAPGSCFGMGSGGTNLSELRSRAEARRRTARRRLRDKNNSLSAEEVYVVTNAPVLFTAQSMIERMENYVVKTSVGT